MVEVLRSPDLVEVKLRRLIFAELQVEQVVIQSICLSSSLPCEDPVEKDFVFESIARECENGRLIVLNLGLFVEVLVDHYEHTCSVGLVFFFDLDYFPDVFDVDVDVLGDQRRNGDVEAEHVVVSFFDVD